MPAGCLTDMSAQLTEYPALAENGPPRTPDHLDDVGLPEALIEQILVRILYARAEVSANELAAAAGLRFGIIADIIQKLRLQNVIQVKRSLEVGEISAILALTESGRNKAREFLEISHYAGPVPVPLGQYAEMVRRQRRAEGWLTGEKLARAYRHMVLSEGVLDQIGPAVSSGRSFLIYGKPGNGKTFLAEALADIDDESIYIPHAIECQGQIVRIYDPALHTPSDDAGMGGNITFDQHVDRRWIRIRRPFVTSGGELTLAMLDLSYNAATKIYEAPFQLKANNGIYLIDDFGRQKASPAEILNRWIVPLERGIDYLTLRSGGKMTIPFEAFLTFSTNLEPAQLGDEAFLRRIQYKMHLRSPDRQEFVSIFRKVCAAFNLHCPDHCIDNLIAKRYGGRPFRRCHPRDVLSHALDLVKFERRPPELDDALLDRAFNSCFVEAGGETWD